MKPIVIVVGASEKKDRYSNKVAQELVAQGYRMVPVRPHLVELYGSQAFGTLANVKTAIDGPVDTLTMYVNADVSTPMEEDILKIKPRRVIFNPGAENDNLATNLRNHGIEVVNDCSWIMLRAGKF